MKKTINFIKNNYHILILLLMFGVCLSMMIRGDFQSDDYRYHRIALCGWKEIFEFLKWHIQNYNGRTFIHFLVILSLKNKITVNIWRVCGSLITCLICVIIAKITSENKTDFRLGCAVSVLMIMGTIPNFWSLSLYWQTGWFNYFLPCFLLLLLIMLFRKNPKSAWIFPLSFFCGATTEQVGLMTIGLFVLLLAQFIYENRKFSSRLFAQLVTASAGYATVILSPGTFARSTDQGELALHNIFINFITILRRRWIDNLCIFLMIFALNFFIAYWLIKFRNKSRFTSYVNLPLGIAVSVGTIGSCALKVFLVLMTLTDGGIEFSDTLNNCLFVLWMIYAALFILSFLYAAWLIYIYNGESIPFISFVIGAGSQLMMIMSKVDMDRTCTTGFLMFMIFIAYSIKFFAADVKQNKNETIRKRFNTEAIVAFVCVCACAAQVIAGVVMWHPDNVDYIDSERFPFEKMSSEKMKEYTDVLKAEKQKTFSTPREEFDIKDFTWLHG